jgi:hypothetical protein
MLSHHFIRLCPLVLFSFLLYRNPLHFSTLSGCSPSMCWRREADFLSKYTEVLWLLPKLTHFYIKDESSVFLPNVQNHLPDYTARWPRGWKIAVERSSCAGGPELKRHSCDRLSSLRISVVVLSPSWQMSG